MSLDRANEGWTALLGKDIVDPATGNTLQTRGKLKFVLDESIDDIEVEDDEANEQSVVRIPAARGEASIIKEPVRLATAEALPAYSRVGNILTLGAPGALTIDGELVAIDDRILVAHETGGSLNSNGIYTVSYAGDGGPAILVRSTDADESEEFSSGMRVPVLEGATNAGLIYELATDADPIVLNATPLSFVVQRSVIGGALVNELRAQIAAATVGQKLFLRGYNAPNDGAQGTCTVVASGTDDDGTVFVATGFGTTGKAATRDDSGDFDPRWFGATGNGSTADTTAVQKAINSAASAGRAVRLRATAGGYSVDTINLADGVRFTADRGAFLQQRTIDTIVLQGANADHIEVEGVRVQAVAGDSSGYGIVVTESDVATIHRCHVIGFGGAHIYTHEVDHIDVCHNIVDGTGSDTVTDPGVGSTRMGIKLNQLEDHQAHAIVCHNFVSNVMFGMQIGAASFVALGNHINDISSSPFSQHAMYVGGENMTIVGNIIRNFRLSGIKVYFYTSTRDLGRVAIADNTIDGGAGKTWSATYEYGLDDYVYKSGRLQRCIAAGTSGGVEPTWPTVTGNTVVDGTVTWQCLGTQTIAAGSGLELNGPNDDVHYARGLVAHDNLIANMNGYGIGLTLNWRGAHIHHNDIKDCGSSGVLLTSDVNADHVRIDSNTLVRVCLVDGHAIQISAASVVDCLIEHNTFDGVPATGGSGAQWNIAAVNCTGLRILENEMFGASGAGALSVGSSTGVRIQRNHSENPTRSGVTTKAWDANSWDLSADGTPMTAAALTYDKSIVSPAITHNALTSDATPTGFTITTQAPYSGATSTNRDPPHFVVGLHAPTNGGAAEATARTKRGANVTSAIGSYPAAPGVYTCLWLGNNLSAFVGSTSALFADGTANTYLNVPSGGTIGFAIAGGTQLTLTASQVLLTPALFEWLSTVASPRIRHAQRSGDNPTTNLQIIGQAASSTASAGVNENGGSIVITGGARDGAGNHGSVHLQTPAGTIVEAADIAGVRAFGAFGVTPVARAAAYTQSYSTASRTHAAYTADNESAAYTGAADGEAKLADLNALRVAYENLRAAYESTSQVLNSVIDDHQAYGWLQ